MFRVLFCWILSRAQWKPCALVLTENSFDPTTLSLDNQALGTIGQRDIIQKVQSSSIPYWMWFARNAKTVTACRYDWKSFNHFEISYFFFYNNTRASNWPIRLVVEPVLEWVHFWYQKFARSILIELWIRTQWYRLRRCLIPLWSRITQRYLFISWSKIQTKRTVSTMKHYMISASEP